tara:strand:- start:255471 stop:256730 length:1260 start_codon:yes stop_codon:yes gene_type:complete
MILKNKNTVFLSLLALTLLIGCREESSIYDPNYEPSRPDPVISSISPASGYLAGVDSVIITGENFVNGIDSMIVNFGGSPGVITAASPTQLVVRPGTIFGEDLPVRVGVRGAINYSNPFLYTLYQPFGLYAGLTNSDAPTSPIAVDGDNNIYTIINNNGLIRYTKVSPDGTVTVDDTGYPGEGTPTNNTMRFTEYSTMLFGPDDNLYMAQQGIRAIFTKTFGDGAREGVWAASSASAFKIRDMVFDNNGYLWAVGDGSNKIHRFDVASKSETQFDFEGLITAVAYYSNDNELYVGGIIDSTQKVWKFSIDGSGNIGAGELYFDYGSKYNGTITSMILASSGELLITTGAEVANVEKPSILRVYPDGRYEELFPGMLKPGAFTITWRDDEFAVVGVKGLEESSINFLNMYDRNRAGIFGF